MSDTTTDPRTRLADLLASGTATSAEITAAEDAIVDHEADWDGDESGRATVDDIWREHERGQDVVEARRLLHEALRDIEVAINAAEHQSNRLTDLYDVDHVEGRGKTHVEAALLHMRLLLDAARHNAPDAD